jgi:hypothetical protein
VKLDLVGLEKTVKNHFHHMKSWQMLNCMIHAAVLALMASAMMTINHPLAQWSQYNEDDPEKKVHFVVQRILIVQEASLAC